MVSLRAGAHESPMQALSLRAVSGVSIPVLRYLLIPGRKRVVEMCPLVLSLH